MIPNNLVHEAVNLGGQVQGYSGQVFFRKTRKNDPHQYVVIALNFYSKEELFLIAELAESLGFEGFDYETPTIQPITQLDLIAPAGPPVCKVHDRKMVKSKFKNEWICPQRIGESSFCRETVKG